MMNASRPQVAAHVSEGSDPPLIAAIKRGDLPGVKKLLSDGANVHERGEQDWPPLNFAAGRGNLALVKLLLEHGANVTVTGRDNRTPLMIARAANRPEVVALLSDKEKALGAPEDAAQTRPYCKAYPLSRLRRFKGWKEEHKEWRIHPAWPDDLKAELNRPLDDGDVVFIHADLSVTRSMWHGEHVIFDAVTTAWQEFCRAELKFEAPRDL